MHASKVLFPTSDDLDRRDQRRALDALMARMDANLSRLRSGEITREQAEVELANIRAEAARLGL